MAVGFWLKCMPVKICHLKLRFNWPAWMPSDARSRRRATGPLPDRRAHCPTTFPQETLGRDRCRLPLRQGAHAIYENGAVRRARCAHRRPETELLVASAVDL